MPYEIKAKCPCCNKQADGLDGIEKLFGFRKVNGKKIPQSYCRACRKAGCKSGKPCKAIRH